jgi:hypothetical protein
MEQLTQPSGLSHAVGNGTILGLSAGAGDDGMSLDVERRVSGQPA